MPWGSSSERALKGQGNRENRTNVKEVFVKDSQNGKMEKENGVKRAYRKKLKSFLRNEKEELAII